MEKEGVKNHHHHPHSSSTNSINTSTTSLRERHLVGESLVKPPQPADFVLQWGNRKRLRCMKTQVKNETAPVTRTTTVRVEHRAIKSDHNSTAVGSNTNHLSNGHFNLRQRSASPARLAARTLRNTENPGMKGGHNNSNGNGNGNGNNHHSNGGVRGLASPDRVEKKNGGGGHHHSSHDNMMINGIGGGGKTTSSDTKNGNSSGGGGGGGGCGSDVVWPPKFMIALTNKEKEEDFMAIKGSKLPQRPKKRAKFIQRTLNLVSPGGWLCDLTLERYEVREKKISKKKPRGLKAMGNYMDSDSE